MLQSLANNSAFIALGLKQGQEDRELFLEPGDQGYVGGQEWRPSVAPSGHESFVSKGWWTKL